MTKIEQEARRLLLIRPQAFGSNAETARSNAFQRGMPDATQAELRTAVLAEFDGLVEALRAADIEVLVIEDTPEPPKPDALFPNNWVSFHGDGTVVIYPMESKSRRTEVRPELLDELEQRLEHRWPRRLDLSGLTDREAFLEGTGSLVLDRVNRIAYACASSRTTAAGCEAFAEAMGYSLESFAATDAEGRAIYHTNVLLSVGEDFAVLCAEAISDAVERERVRARLQGTGHEIIEISPPQMVHFAGNLLAVRAQDGGRRIVLSSQAHGSLSSFQRADLEKHGALVHAPLDTIETLSGGSARCMLAELHGA